MEIEVEVVQVLPDATFIREGVSRLRHAFVGKTLGRYPKDVHFLCYADEAWGRMGIEPGYVYAVSFNLQSREWSGRWYTDVIAWRAERVVRDE